MMANNKKHEFEVGDIIQLKDASRPITLMVLAKLPVDNNFYKFLNMLDGDVAQKGLTPKFWRKLA